MIDPVCNYAGRILPEGGSVVRGYRTPSGKFAVDQDGELFEFSLPAPGGGNCSSFMTVEQAIYIADSVRALALDTGNVYPSIELLSGEYYDFLHPESCFVDIEDVANSLSMQCRFGGHLGTFYSIAEHSVRASYIEPEVAAFDKLMHDSAESVMLDIMTPLKRMLRDYQLLLHKVEVAFARQFRFEFPLSPAVHHADLVMLATEKRDLKTSSTTNWGLLDGIEPLAETIVPWSPQEAKERFLARYEELRPQ